MKSEKFQRRLSKLFVRAEQALSREAAQKILKKAEKLYSKIRRVNG